MVSGLTDWRFLEGSKSTALLLILAGRFVPPPLVEAGGGGSDGRTGTVAGVIGGDCGAWGAAGARAGAEDNGDVTRPEVDDETPEVGSEDAGGNSDDSPAGAVSATGCTRDRGCGSSESGRDLPWACVI